MFRSVDFVGGNLESKITKSKITISGKPLT